MFPFQAEDLQRIEDLGGRALLASEMGLGKTIQALAYIDRRQLFPAVVVCPASIKWNWDNEAAAHIGRRATILGTTKPPPVNLAPNGIYIINYEVLHFWLKHLKKVKPAILVADEAHYLKTHTTVRFKAFEQLAKGVEKLLLITGTPMTNRPIELFPLLRLLHPSKFHNRNKFGFAFCEPRRRFGRWEFMGATNLRKLNRLLRNKWGMIRRRKKNVLDQLPEKRQVVIPLDAPQTKEYKEAARAAGDWVMTQWRPGMSNDQRMMGLALLGEEKRLAARMKLPQVYEWLDNWAESTGDKLIVFGIHKYIMRSLRERYEGRCLTVTGSTPQHKRKGIFEAFNTSRDYQFFFGNIKAAGTGWSARKCSDVVKVEIDWVPGNHTQATDRTHGIGRGLKGVPSTTYWLVARGTIEERLCKVIQKKQDNIDMALDGKKFDELKVFDLLCQSIKEGEK